MRKIMVVVVVLVICLMFVVSCTIGVDVENIAPVASFTATNQNDPLFVDNDAIANSTTVIPNRLPIDFDAGGSTDTDGTIVTWDWDFDDGNVGTGEIISYDFGDIPGTYDVNLTVIDNDDGTNTITETIIISNT